ncbi:dethiobiotin synthase [Shewanella morhuae]|uniref:ATP-dependent dethiobiotin synthetase BioD n=1 Tax=Shewanella morhuae TaxID=365591 RepID=A0ABX5HSW5_9GAMM|nr:dethiobiotin synthase [Shewanella morhuae]PTA49975.1 dethiobiotin synthase [Shewanella morhuae]
MFFVTGTDTDSGKTLVSSALLTAVNRLGHIASADSAVGILAANTMLTLGIKPIASGCAQTSEGLRNADALQLMTSSSLKLAYAQINPFSFEPAIAPHIAAAQVGMSLTPEVIIDSLDFTAFSQADFCLIEGAGGWRLPLGEGRYLSEVVQKLELPVILVVGMKLGCLNHALLTQEAILADGLTISGWVANRVDPEMSMFDENLASLKEMMSAPFLGSIPFLTEPSAENAADHLDVSLLHDKAY